MVKRSRLVTLERKSLNKTLKHLELDIHEAEKRIVESKKSMKEARTGIARDRATIKYLKGFS